MVACIAARARSGSTVPVPSVHTGGPARLAGALGLLELAQLLDLAFNTRWILHRWFQAQFIALHLYDQRRIVQTVLLILLALVLMLLLGRVFRRLRGRAWAAVATAGGCLSFSFWCVEVISLHQIDRILYTARDGLLTIGWLWIFAALLISIGIMMDAFTSPARG
uniref:DUF2243 domain-containing protein n=1 Tax=Paracidobacterium acidisoli TaxID=2303751 RepID=A0A372IK07_9BACT